MKSINTAATVITLAALLTLAACGGDSEHASGRHRGGPPDGMGFGGGPTSAVPVQVQAVERRAISQHLESNGTLRAENEVDIVARTAGPVTKLHAEEGETVAADQLLAKIDDREARNQVAIATVTRDEARLAFDRAEESWRQGLVSREVYDVAVSSLAAAEAQLESARIQLDYTEIRAPFDAVVVTRNVKLAEYVTSGSALFRVSDFTPLLCLIEVPEKDLPKVRIGQPAQLRVESFPGERFDAKVARIRPTVDAASGTFTVTLEVDGRRRLRPGMFASIYLEIDTRIDSLVIPRDALVLDSLGDTVYVRVGDVAERREVRLGYREEDAVEVVDGLVEGDELIVLGQDGLADGTPVSVLGEETTDAAAATDDGFEAAPGPAPERLEAMRQRMRERGLSDEQIDERLQQMREGGDPGGGRPAVRGEAPTGGDIPPFLADRIQSASPEELESIKQRMRSFGRSDEEIELIVKQVRGE